MVFLLTDLPNKMGHSAHRVCVKSDFLVGVFIGTKGSQGYTRCIIQNDNGRSPTAQYIVEKGIDTLAII